MLNPIRLHNQNRNIFNLIIDFLQLLMYFLDWDLI